MRIVKAGSSFGWKCNQKAGHNADTISFHEHSGPVNHLLQTFLPENKFAPIVTREFRPPKPHPAGILHIASTWGLGDGGEGLIMVGLLLTLSLKYPPAFGVSSHLFYLIPAT